jgi:tetratricopeptide (TPR) repeat protein
MFIIVSFSNILKGDINIMKKREKLDILVLVSTILFLFLTIFSSIALADNNENSIAFQGNYEDAVKAYDKAIENNSQGSDVWYYKGTVLAFQGNFEEAIKAFDKAIEIDPQFASAWYNKGLCLEILGKYEEAIEAFDKAIEIAPKNLDVWVNKGVCLTNLGNYEEAIEAFDKAIEINSQESVLWYNKGTCLMNLGYYEDYKEAIKAFDKAIEIEPKKLNAWINKGACLDKVGDYEEAIKAYDKAIEIDPQYPDAWYDKGTTLAFSQGNYEEAIKAYDKAIEIDPQFASAWYNKGLCLVYLGNYKEAIKAFDKAIEIDPQNPDSWYNKGLCLAHLGNCKEAVEALDKAIEIAPQHDYALSLKESILLNPNKSFFSNSNIFVEEDDLLEYAQTYLKTYEDIINESNLTRDDLGLFSFNQSYPYAVNATISNTSGASITFIPHSIDKSKVTQVPYPIGEQIPKITKEFMNSNPRRVMSINGNSSGIQMYDNTVFTVSENGNISGGNIWNNMIYNNATDNRFIYINSSNNDFFYEVTDNTSIVLADEVLFNGLTYIDSNKLFRVDDLVINGTLVLNDSRVIMKSNLKKDWTKERAEEDAIDLIYKELIDEVFEYSKLTGIGFHKIEKLVAEYKEREMKGYYEINEIDKWSDRQAIFDTANYYGIPHESVTIELLENKQKTKLENLYRDIEVFLTTYSFIIVIIGSFTWFKRKRISQKLKKIFRD